MKLPGQHGDVPALAVYIAPPYRNSAFQHFLRAESWIAFISMKWSASISSSPSLERGCHPVMGWERLRLFRSVDFIPLCSLWVIHMRLPPECQVTKKFELPPKKTRQSTARNQYIVQPHKRKSWILPYPFIGLPSFGSYNLGLSVLGLEGIFMTVQLAC